MFTVKIYSRFSNLPFQSWELRPDTANRAVIALSAAAVQAEFALEPGLVTLVKFSSGNKPPVKGIIDVPMKLKDLIKEMRHQVCYSEWSIWLIISTFLRELTYSPTVTLTATSKDFH